MKRAKDITLVTLILISVLLFSRVWFGTNFIGEIKKNIMFAKAAYESETKSFTIESIITPENIIVTGGGKRRVVSKGQNGYDELFERMKSAAENRLKPRPFCGSRIGRLVRFSEITLDTLRLCRRIRFGIARKSGNFSAGRRIQKHCLCSVGFDSRKFHGIYKESRQRQGIQIHCGQRQR